MTYDEYVEAMHKANMLPLTREREEQRLEIEHEYRAKAPSASVIDRRISWKQTVGRSRCSRCGPSGCDFCR